MPLLDWIVIAVFLAGVTWLGHHLSGRTLTRRDYFQSSGTLPWWAVAASIVSTKTSAVTFVAVPAAVFAAGGNLGYMQALLGFIVGTLIIALWYVPEYRRRAVDTVFDYVSLRTDPVVGRLSLALGIGTSWLSVSVRLLTTAIVLSVVTGWSVAACTISMAIFSLLWSWFGGIKTVIWTDTILYVVFTGGAFIALFHVFGDLPVPFSEAWAWLESTGRTAIFNLSTDPRINYTLWTGLLGASLSELSNAISQSTLQRAKSCRSDRDAIWAFVAAAPLSISGFLMLAVGLGVSVYYNYNPLDAATAASMATQPDRIFPHFIVHALPAGLTGLLIAAIFAAASLNSVLTELSDLTVTNVYEPYIARGKGDRHYLAASKGFLLFWAVVITAFTIFVSKHAKGGLLDLAFQLPGYVGGASLGTILIARMGIGRWPSFLVGLAASFGTIYWLQKIGISFWWWFPAGALALVTVVAIAHPFVGRAPQSPNSA